MLSPDQLMDRVSTERQALMQDMTGDAAGHPGVLLGVEQMLTAGSALATAVTGAVQTLDTYTSGVSQRLAAAGKQPADVVDLRALMGDVAQAAEHLQGLTESLNALLLSPGWEQRLPQLLQVLPAPAPVAKAPHTPPPAIDAARREAASHERPALDTRPMIERIVQQGRFRAVVYHDFAPFSFVDAHGNRVGFDIDLMRECARRWVGDANAVTFVPVEADRRISTLLEGKADIIAAALTKTPSRQQEIAFSHTYFEDGQRLLVPEPAEVSDVCDLQGKKIALTSGSTAVVNVQAQLDRCGVAAVLVSVDTHAHGVEAVLTGAADAFSTDGLALEQWAKGRPLQVVGNHFSEEPYGPGLRKGKDDFLRLLNLTLEVMYADGTLAALYHKWFADSLRPYPIPSIVTGTAEPALLHPARTELPALFPPIQEPVPFAKEYTVQRGDTLSRLAGKFYGDVSPGSWQRIYAANQEVIGPHPSRLRIGTRLRIPPP